MRGLDFPVLESFKFENLGISIESINVGRGKLEALPDPVRRPRLKRLRLSTFPTTLRGLFGIARHFEELVLIITHPLKGSLALIRREKGAYCDGGFPRLCSRGLPQDPVLIYLDEIYGTTTYGFYAFEPRQQWNNPLQFKTQDVVKDAEINGPCQVKIMRWRIVSSDNDSVELTNGGGEEMTVWSDDEMDWFRERKLLGSGKKPSLVGRKVMQINVFYENKPDVILQSGWDL